MIPTKLERTLERQKTETLHEVKDLIEEILNEREKEIEPEDIPEKKNREVVSVKKAGKITYQLEKVYCGKNCSGCPHGPYWYAYWKEDGQTKSKYIGKDREGLKS